MSFNRKTEELISSLRGEYDLLHAQIKKMRAQVAELQAAPPKPVVDEARLSLVQERVWELEVENQALRLDRDALKAKLNRLEKLKETLTKAPSQP